MGNYSTDRLARRKLSLERLEDRRVLTADFNGNGVVDAPDLDIWKTGFGAVGTANQTQGDANGDTNVDGADFLLWQRTLGQSTVPPVAPKGVQARAVGPTSIEVTWQASPTATSYSVLRRQPGTETQFSIIASGVTATTYTDTGLASDTLYQYRLIAHRNPDSVVSEQAEGITNRSNLTAHRPQFVQDHQNPVNTPIYDPFPRTAVLEQDEMHANLGPGIRINHDFDNGGGTPDALLPGVAIPLENDLIEMTI